MKKKKEMLNKRKKTNNVVQGQGEGQKKRGCCGSGKGKQKKIEQSQGEKLVKS